MRDVLVADEDLARGGLIEPGDAAQHGRLAAPRWAEQYEELAVAHVERQVRDRLHAAGIICLGETAQRDGRHAGAALMPAREPEVHRDLEADAHGAAGHPTGSKAGSARIALGRLVESRIRALDHPDRALLHSTGRVDHR